MKLRTIKPSTILSWATGGRVGKSLTLLLGVYSTTLSSTVCMGSRLKCLKALRELLKERRQWASSIYASLFDVIVSPSCRLASPIPSSYYSIADETFKRLWILWYNFTIVRPHNKRYIPLLIVNLHFSYVLGRNMGFRNCLCILYSFGSIAL